MRPAGRNGERRRHRDHVRVSLGDPREQRREAQIVADRQPELADRGAVHHHRAVAGPIDRRIRASSRRSEGRRRTDGSCRSGRGSCRAGRSRNRGWRPCRRRAGWRASPGGPRCHARAPLRSRPRAPGVSSSEWILPAARLESRSSRPDISGVNSIAASPFAASPIASTRASALALGSMPVFDWKRAIRVTRRSTRRAGPRLRARRGRHTRRYVGRR